MTRTAALLLAVLLSGCSSDDSKPATVPQDPTFTRVLAEVIKAKNCGANGTLCHTSIAGKSAGGFKIGTSAQIYDELLNQEAGGAQCSPSAEAGIPSRKRVVPGDPENSLLYQKITDTAPCGDPMPKGQPLLDVPQIQLVHDWIKAGAKND